MKPLLIIQADDAGIHPAVDRGILETIESGSVTSVGILVCGDSVAPFAEEVKRKRQISTGLHVALTRFCALASTNLARSGERMPDSWRSLARRLARGAVGQEDIAEELRAQITRARRLGLTVDHLSGHEHVHLLPGVAEVVAKVAQEMSLPSRVRITRTPRTELARNARAIALRAASSLARRTAFKRFASPDRVVGIADHGGAYDLLGILRGVRPKAAIELIVHPGDRPRAGETGLPTLGGRDWVGELDGLLTHKWRDLLAESYVLGTYRDL